MMNSQQQNNLRQSIRTRFSSASGTYDVHASVQVAVAERLVSIMPHGLVGPRADILEVGCGTGKLTKLLLEHFPSAHIQALDISEKMLSSLAAALTPEEQRRISLVSCDFDDLDASCAFDFVTGSASLHWIMPFSEAAAGIKACLVPGGSAAFAVMAAGTLAELHEARNKVSSDNPPLGSLPDCKTIRADLAANLRELAWEEQNIRMEYRSAREFLKAIHEQGLTGGAPSVGSRPLTRGELDELCGFYDSTFKTEAGVYASFHVCYFVGKRVEPSS